MRPTQRVDSSAGQAQGSRKCANSASTIASVLMLYELGPRAKAVYQHLLDRIRSGELAAGSRLPAHTQLALTYGVAPLTMRQVLARLESDSLVVRERGRGTFVRAANLPHVLVVAADPSQRSNLEVQVRAAGKRLILTASPAEALAAVEREAPLSLAILDLHLPQVSTGLRLARSLRQRLPELPIAAFNPTRGQRTRLEHTVAPPLLFVGDPPLDQLSDVLRNHVVDTSAPTKVLQATTAQRLHTLVDRYVAFQLAGERSAARALILQEGLATGLSPAELYASVLAPAQYQVGELWQHNQISIAREHLATAVTEAVMGNVVASASPEQDTGLRVVVACVEGELHQIGARMVADLLELDGFGVRFLGADVPTSSLLAIVAEESAELLVLSAAMPERLAQLRAAVVRARQMYAERLRIYVGGQIMDWAAEFVSALEVDLATRDARETLAGARRLVSEHARPVHSSSG
jgi:MerR family transcriptional regulator, light-induced transcriptional regulator